jgi:hypothetical protein
MAGAPAATPDAAMQSFIDAMDAQRWHDAARYIDTASFSRWLRDQIDVTRRSMRKEAVESLLEQFATMPTIDSLRRLSTNDAAAQWLRVGDPRWVTDRAIVAMKQQGCVFDSAAVAELIASIRPDSQLVVGSIERDSIAFVVVQQLLRDPGEYGREPHDAALTPRVFRMRRSSSGWVIVDWEQWSTGRGQFMLSAPCVKKKT